MVIHSRRRAATAPVVQKQPEPQPVAQKEIPKKKIKKISFEETIPVEEKAKKILEEIEEEVLQEDKN